MDLDGHAKTKHNEALKFFVSSCQPSIFDTVQLSPLKILKDWLKKISQVHREIVARKTTASEIIEMRSEQKQLLNDFVTEIDKLEELRRLKRTKRLDIDHYLYKSGENNRNMDVSRASFTILGSGMTTTGDSLLEDTPSERENTENNGGR